MPMTNTHPLQDQAASLRRMFHRQGLRVLPVFGGEERLPVAIHLAAAAAAEGLRVVLLDASRGEVAPALGLSARWELKHLIEGEKHFHDVALKSSSGVLVVPAARGVEMLAAQGGQGNGLFGAFARLSEPADLVVVNAPNTRSAAVLPSFSGESLVALSAASSSLTEAWAAVKSLRTRFGMTRFRSFILYTDNAEAQRLRERLAAHLGRELGVVVHAGGAAPADPSLRAALSARRTLSEIDSDGPAARAFASTAVALGGWELARPAQQELAA